MTKVFFPKEGTIKIDATGDVSLSASTVLDTAFASATTITGQFKDFSATAPTGDVDKIDLIGTTSSFQNAELQENPAPLGEFSGTIIIPGDELMEGEIFGSGTAAGGTHTGYQPGLATRTKLAVLFNVDDGTDEVNFAIGDALITEYSPTMGSDNHLEASVTFKCLPKDFYGPQFKD
jgi:hypothetical protein|tara:strand:+ start:74 stop:604 length:531 start_codon:yes stop_codon:yes gene_type:complete